MANKEMNENTIRDAVQTLYDHRGKPYEEVRSIMEQKGYAWSIEDSERYRELHEPGMDSREGFRTGNLAYGVTLVANAVDSEEGYRFCGRFMSDESELGVGQWLRLAKERAGRQVPRFSRMIDDGLASVHNDEKIVELCIRGNETHGGLLEMLDRQFEKRALPFDGDFDGDFDEDSDKDFDEDSI